MREAAAEPVLEWGGEERPDAGIGVSWEGAENEREDDRGDCVCGRGGDGFGCGGSVLLLLLEEEEDDDWWR